MSRSGWRRIERHLHPALFALVEDFDHIDKKLAKAARKVKGARVTEKPTLAEMGVSKQQSGTQRASSRQGAFMHKENKLDWSKIRLTVDHPAASYNQPVLDLGDGDLALGPFDIMPDGYGAPLADAFVRANRERFDPQLVEKFLRFGSSV